MSAPDVDECFLPTRATKYMKTEMAYVHATRMSVRAKARFRTSRCHETSRKNSGPTRVSLAIRYDAGKRLLIRVLGLYHRRGLAVL